MFRPNNKAYLILIIIFTMTLTGCSLFPAKEEPLKMPLVKPQQDKFRTVAVKRGTIISETFGSGSLESYYSESLKFSADGGFIKKISAKLGHSVKKGDVLVELDIGNMDIELKQLEHNIAKSGQAVKAAKLAENADALKVAEVQYDVDRIKYERLLKGMKNTQLIAGMDGVVSYVAKKQVGDKVAALETMVVLADSTKLRAEVRMEPGRGEVHNIGAGISALVKLRGSEFKGKVFTGKVTQAPSTVPKLKNEELSRFYTSFVVIEFDEELPKEATVGMKVEVIVPLQEREDVLVIPSKGLREYMGNNFVRVLDDENKLIEVDVATGIIGESEIEITEGLKEGQLIEMP